MQLRKLLAASLALIVSVTPAQQVSSVTDRGSSNIATPLSPASTPFWGDYRRGWHFYEDPPPPALPGVPETALPKPGASPQPTPRSPRSTELEEFARLKQQMEDYRNIAIMRPTEANVSRYMRLEAQVVRQAVFFSEVTRRVALSDPSLDMTLEGRPVNVRALQAYESDQSSGRSNLVRTLSGNHVLFFFFRSDCPYCHAFAPTLKAFEQRHGMRVVPISTDGGALPDFPQFRKDNGIAKNLRVTQVPAVFLANPTSGVISSLGSGVLSETEILERIETVTNPATNARATASATNITMR